MESFKLGKYEISRAMDVNSLREADFNIVKLKEQTIYITKSPVEVDEYSYWITIYCDNNGVSRIELANADEKLKMNYQNMTNELVEAVTFANNNFLKSMFGQPTEVTVTGNRYVFSWCEVTSYFDNKSCNAGIVILLK